MNSNASAAVYQTTFTDKSQHYDDELLAVSAKYFHYRYRKSAHLYGHVHNNAGHVSEDAARLDVLSKRAINVGVDVNNFYPVSADTVYSRAFEHYDNDGRYEHNR